MVTTKENLRKAKENKSVYTGRIKKNWIVEVFGKKFKIEEIFKDTKLCKRTVEGKEFLLASKVVNVPEVGRLG
jgi:fructosamine-3-kinase